MVRCIGVDQDLLQEAEGVVCGCGNADCSALANSIQGTRRVNPTESLQEEIPIVGTIDDYRRDTLKLSESQCGATREGVMLRGAFGAAGTAAAVHSHFPLASSLYRPWLRDQRTCWEGVLRGPEKDSSRRDVCQEEVTGQERPMGLGPEEGRAGKRGVL